MPLITLSVPQEKLPLLHDILNAIGIKNNGKMNMLSAASHFERKAEAKNITSSVFKKYFNWEYFSNELEFE